VVEVAGTPSHDGTDVLLLGVDRSHCLVLIDRKLHWFPREAVTVHTWLQLYETLTVESDQTQTMETVVEQDQP
jgi:hypothetical protein